MSQPTVQQSSWPWSPYSCSGGNSTWPKRPSARGHKDAEHNRDVSARSMTHDALEGDLARARQNAESGVSCSLIEISQHRPKWRLSSQRGGENAVKHGKQEQGLKGPAKPFAADRRKDAKKGNPYQKADQHLD